MSMTMPPAPKPPERVNWQAMYKQHGSKLQVVEQAIVTAQQKTQITLTPDATEIILLPFLAEFQRGVSIPAATVTATINRIFIDMQYQPDVRDTGQVRSALSVIQTWWRNWCDLPPICRPVEQ